MNDIEAAAAADGPTADADATAAAWAEVADVLGVPTADAAPATPGDDGAVPAANLGMALRSIHRRKGLRRILILVGAIVPGQQPPTAGDAEGDVITTDQLVGKLMRLDADQLERMIRRAGMISSEPRITEFAQQIAAESGQHDPNDPVAVHVWIGHVGAILRGQA